MNQQRFNAVFNKLSDRRREVLLKLLANETDKAIAKSLHIATSTVRKHREEICEHFGLTNDFPDQRCSKLPELIALFSKYRPDLLHENASKHSEAENVKQEKNISENPNFVIEQDENNKPVTEKQLAELIKILQGIKQDEQTKISSANLIALPPNLDYWQGRKAETQQIQTWLADTKVKTIGIHGLSGVGKSWLAAYLYNSSDFEAKFWADVRQGTDFTIFAQNALMQLSGISSEQLVQLSETEELIFALLDALKHHQCLLVIDNLETLIDKDRHFLGAYKDFFIRWIEHGSGSKLMITTQTQPEVMDGHPYWLSLQGLEAKDGELLLKELGIFGSSQELQDFSNYINGHPKMLRLVASKLKSGTHIQEAEKLGLRQLDLLLNQVPMPYRDRERVFFVWILQQHFDNLNSELQNFFINLSLYRRSFDRDAAAVVFPNEKPLVDFISLDKLRQSTPNEKELEPLKNVFDTVKMTGLGLVMMNSEGNKSQYHTIYWKTQHALDELKNRSLLDIQQGQYCYQFHPFVLQYAKQKSGNQQESLRERVIAYYLSIGSDSSTWQTLDHVAPHLEVIYHLCEMKSYALAFETLRIYKEALDLLGYYSVQLEIYQYLVRVWEPKEEEYSEFIAALIDLGGIYTRLAQYQEAINILQMALVKEREISNSQGEAAALNNLGVAYQKVGQYEQAINCHQQQLKIARQIKNIEEETNALSNLGVVCYLLGRYQEAIDYQQQKLILIQNMNDPRREAHVLGNLGGAYIALEEHQKALDCHLKQLEIAKSIMDIPMEARALGGLGVVYNQLNKPQEAIEIFQEALSIVQEIGERDLESACLLNLSNSYMILGHYLQMQAIAYCKESLKVSEQIGSPDGAAKALYNLGSLLARIGETSEAIIAYQKASDLFKNLGLYEYVERISKVVASLS
ncbi:tetratricopeptide repeat protein [Calothrix sp. FACHB-156]|nr:tetratricopeptide repeat protein [Calothrix sp. FACHB-156]